MLLHDLEKKKLIEPPPWLSDNCGYLTIMGSMAYGVSSDSSDYDVYGFCFPPKTTVFPHLAGEIFGFSSPKHRFDQWQQHHIYDQSACCGHGREYDFQVFSIVKYFRLCMDNNPNMIDSLFTPTNCVLHSTKPAHMVREKRRIFLHRGAWHTFKGYAWSQLHKMQTKDPVGKRKITRAKFGFDVKFAYHIVRLAQEVEQILTEGDIDLQRGNETLKAIRRGEWTEEQIRDWFTKKLPDLETMYANSKLPWGPDEMAIRQLLVDCLEEHYGDLSKCVTNPDRATAALAEVAEVLRRYETKQPGSLVSVG